MASQIANNNQKVNRFLLNNSQADIKHNKKLSNSSFLISRNCVLLYLLQSRATRIPTKNMCVALNRRKNILLAFTLCVGQSSRFWIMFGTCAQHSEWMPPSLLRPSKSGRGMRRDAEQRLSSFWPRAINHLLLHTLPILTLRPLTHLGHNVTDSLSCERWFFVTFNYVGG